LEAIRPEPEEKFILHCLRTYIYGQRGINVPSFIDWDTVHRKAHQWAITPILGKFLNSQSPSIPVDFVQKVKLAYLRTFAVNELNYRRLVEVLKVLGKAGIRVILLKGAHLAYFIYQDIGLRAMGDIDILIRKEDLARVEGILLEMGYKYYTFTNSVQWYKNNHFHLPFTSPQGIKHLEVHWDFVMRDSIFDIDMDGIWERAKEVKIYGTDVMILSHEDAILHLCFHMAHDDMLRGGIRPLFDIAMLLKRHTGDIKWSYLIQITRAWGIERYLYLILHLISDLIGMSIPYDPLQRLIDDGFDRGMLHQAQRRIFLRETTDPVITNITHMERLHPDVRSSEKIRNIFHQIFIPPDEMRIRYRLPSSSKRIYLYYLIRPFSLLYKKSFLFKLLINGLFKKQYNLDSWLLSANTRGRLHRMGKISSHGSGEKI